MNSKIIKFLDQCYDGYFAYKNQFLKYLTMEEEKFGYHWNSAFAILLCKLAWMNKQREFMWHVDEFMRRKLAETPQDRELAEAIKNYIEKKRDPENGFIEGIFMLGFFFFIFCPSIAIFVIPISFIFYYMNPFGWWNTEENNQPAANEQNHQE